MTLHNQTQAGSFNPAATHNDRFVSRSTRIVGRTGNTDLFVEPTPYWSTRDVWQALHGYAVARLSEGQRTQTFASNSAHFWCDYLAEHGFSEADVIRHQIGLIPSFAEARQHLRSVGFTEYDINSCGLPTGTNGLAGDVLLVPFNGLPGQPGGFAFRGRSENAEWVAKPFGPVVGDASHLAYDHIAISTDPLETTAVRDTGMSETYFASASMASKVTFWESLADHGVDRVTLVTAAVNGEWDRLEQAAGSACDARCTPAVDLYELPAAAGRSISFYVKQIGAESFRRELSRRHQSTPAPVMQPTPSTIFDTVTYWASVRPQLAAISDVHLRRRHERLASEVGELLASGRYVNASQAIDAALEGTGISMLPRSTSHHVEYVRSASARDAMATRLFDLLRTTSGNVTVVTPLSYDEFVQTIASHAANQATTTKFGTHFAGRSAEQLRAELQTYGYRLQVISTPRPVAFTESGSQLLRRTDVILVDATGQAQTFWWQENGWAAQLTELAEDADCDLIAFWAVDRTERPVDYSADLIATLRHFTGFAF